MAGVNPATIPFGTWQLRAIGGDLTNPISSTAYITTLQLCFAQKTFQACLNQVAPGIGAQGPNKALIDKAAKALIGQGLLPDDAVVKAEGALADVAGALAVGNCNQALPASSPEKCLPSVVVAAVELPKQDPGTVKEPGLLAGVSAGDFADALIAAGVLTVLEDVTEAVVDEKGQPAVLAKGDYRVDLLQLQDRKNWLVQFVSAGTRFYRTSAPVTLAGAPVTGDKDVGAGDVVLEIVSLRPCRADGNEEGCCSLLCSLFSNCGCKKITIPIL